RQRAHRRDDAGPLPVDARPQHPRLPPHHPRVAEVRPTHRSSKPDTGPDTRVRRTKPDASSPTHLEVFDMNDQHQLDPYLIISADSHAGLPTAEYREYLDSKYHRAFDEFLAQREAQLDAITKLGVRNE